MSPPLRAPVATYRPAVSVRNNGIAAATASGDLRIYDRTAGTLIATHILPGTEILPGAVRNVQSAALLELVPGDIGRELLFIATVSCPGDMVPENNDLPPTSVIVTDETPPPPPIIPPHSETHEAGGSDPLNVAGLPGVLLSPQTPTPHAANHASDSTDAINVAGLPGVLAEAQTPKHHANEAHTVPLQPVTDKGIAGGYAGLGPDGRVPTAQLGGAEPTGAKFLRSDRTWVEGIAVLPSFGVPVAPVPLSEPLEGTSPDAARADHVHPETGAGIISDGDVYLDPSNFKSILERVIPYELVVSGKRVFRVSAHGNVGTGTAGAARLGFELGAAHPDDDFISQRFALVEVPLLNDLDPEAIWCLDGWVIRSQMFAAAAVLRLTYPLAYGPLGASTFLHVIAHGVSNWSPPELKLMLAARAQFCTPGTSARGMVMSLESRL